MKPKTAELWIMQDRTVGDRQRLFTAVARTMEADTVLYPGCFVDVAASFVFSSVTYVDMDKRTPNFFDDYDGVTEIIARHNGPREPDITFINADYTTDLELPPKHFDLLVSLYAGFISEHCTQHLKIGGSLLVNPSHGDAAMASVDSRYELTSVVLFNDEDYQVDTQDLDTYLIPKKPQAITAEQLHQLGRGINTENLRSPTCSREPPKPRSTWF